MIHLAKRSGSSGFLNIPGKDLASKAEREIIAYTKMFDPIRGLSAPSLKFQLNQYHNIIYEKTVLSERGMYNAWPSLSNNQKEKYKSTFVNMVLFMLLFKNLK